jgi:RHS repeat-associated protein
MKIRAKRSRAFEISAFTLLLILFVPNRVVAQDPTGYATGFPPNGVFDGSDFDTVQTSNGNLHIHVPLYQVKGRGPSLFLSLHYDNLAYYSTERCVNTTCYVTWHDAGGGWALERPTAYHVSYSTVNFSTCNTHVGIYAATGMTMTEPDGTSHHFVPDQPMIINGCFTTIPNGVLYADDGSGWMLKVDPNSGTPINGPLGFELVSKDGTQITATFNNQTQIVTTVLTDPNGNQITETLPESGSNPGTITDTLGRVTTIPLSLAATFSSTPWEIDYTDSSGTPQKIQGTMATPSSSYPLSGCNDPPYCVPAPGVGSMPSQITLPNGLQYNFNYFNPTYPNGVYGEIFNATLPTGGGVAWTWQFIGGPRTQLTTRTVSANGNNYIWNYAYTLAANGNPPYTTVTDANHNDTVYTFGAGPATYSDYKGTAGPSMVQSYSGTGGSRTLLETVTTTYTTSNTLVPISETTTWAQTSQTSQVQTDWDSFSTGQRVITWKNPINKREYAFGNGAPGGLVRTTSNNYLHLTNSTYLTLNIANKPTSTIIYEADGVTVHGKTLYSYDSTTLGSTSGAIGHDYTHFSSSNTLRGNSTLIQRWRNTDGALLNTYNYYNDVGNLIQATDPASHNTYFDYTDSWYQSSCAPSSGTAQAFVTKTTNALSQITTAKHNSCSSRVGSTTDANGQTATYAYDSMGRRTQTNFPDGGQTTVTFGSTLPINNVSTTKITSSQNHVTTAVLDDLGRVKQAQLNSDPSGVVYTDTTYDAFGRVLTVSNPYRSTSDPTYGITTNQYDALARTIKVTKPDGSFVTTAYCGSTTLVTDEATKWRRSTTDALGRLVEVDEPNSSTASVNSNGCPGTGEPIWITSYSYDVVGNLTAATQSGSRQRSFIYDSLSSLISSTNPEAGTVLYTYDSEEKLLTKKDARSTTITYGYEALHRMTSRTYSNGDPTVTYTYDQSACLGQPTCFNIGRRTSVTDAAGSETVSYDKMGRELTHQRVTNSIPKTTSYTYNLDGSLATLIYPSTRTITYAYDAAARPVSAMDAANNINYAAAGAYAPQGALSALTLGSATGFSGVNLSDTYNNRLQPNEVKVWSTAGMAFDLSYCFNAWNTSTNTCSTTPGSNNGNVNGIANNLDVNRSQFFTYDQLNRVLTGQTVSTFSTSTAKCWGESFVYDAPGGGAWGNLIQINVAATAYNGCTQENLNVGLSANNQLSATGYSYDASGNFLSDARNTYVWNAESEIKTANTVNYTYDGDGNRVQKSNGKIYWYGAGSEILDESDLSGNITDEYVFFGGKRIAHRTVSGNGINYYAEDFLGTTRVMTTSNGTLCYDADYYPYGGERAPYTNTCTGNYKFEGKEHDTETNNDNFGARSYASAIGRWVSPDWSSTPVAVPYANLSNPQTLNLYAMVHDNPETFADLDGHDGPSQNPISMFFKQILRLPAPPPKTTQTNNQQGGQNNGTQAAAPVTGATAKVTAQNQSNAAAAPALSLAACASGGCEAAAIGAGAAALVAVPVAGMVAAIVLPAMEQGDPMTPGYVPAPAVTDTPASTSQQGAVDTSPMAAHSTGERESTRPGHQEGEAREARDRGGEKGDESRTYPRKPPDGWKERKFGNRSGKWPPTSPRDQGIADGLMGR